MEGVKTDDDELSFLFLNFDITGSQDFNNRRVRLCWQRQEVGIIKMNFRITRSHFVLKITFSLLRVGGWVGSVHRLLLGADMRIRFNLKNIQIPIPSSCNESIGTKILKEFYKKCALAHSKCEQWLYTHINMTSIFPKLSEKELNFF